MHIPCFKYSFHAWPLFQVWNVPACPSLVLIHRYSNFLCHHSGEYQLIHRIFLSILRWDWKIMQIHSLTFGIQRTNKELIIHITVEWHFEVQVVRLLHRRMGSLVRSIVPLLEVLSGLPGGTQFLSIWTWTSYRVLLIYELRHFSGWRLNFRMTFKEGANQRNPTIFPSSLSKSLQDSCSLLFQVFPQQICHSLLGRKGAYLLS